MWRRFCFIVLAFWGPAHSQIYQCKDVNCGKVLQQAPCVDGKKVDARPSGALGGNLLGGKNLEAERAKETRRQHLQAAIEQRRPIVGMSIAELNSAVGSPTRRNSSDYGRGTEDQLIYERGDRTLYVYARDGQVTSVQDRESLRPPPKEKSSSLRAYK